MESEPDNEVDLEALANALDELGRLDPELAVIVDLRFIAGLSLEETARVTGLSPATVKRRWSLARGWLRNTIESGEDDG
jgi:RNA polymerase sigma factor (sigma-70 family)